MVLRGKEGEKVIPGTEVAENMRWLENQVIKGAQILDIGLDASRLNRLSKFYAAEKAFLLSKGYVRQFVGYVKIIGKDVGVWQWLRVATQ